MLAPFSLAAMLPVPLGAPGLRLSATPWQAGILLASRLPFRIRRSALPACRQAGAFDTALPTYHPGNQPLTGR